MTAIRGDYRTHKHIPSRSCYQLIIEIPEADFPNACQVLGYPTTGENTFVGIALLDKSIVTKPETICDKEQSEGDKLRVRAVLLCKQKDFQHFTKGQSRSFILATCNIKSRADLVHDEMAQVKFKELLRQFDAWKLENRYPDEIGRM